jgi:aspartyl-tRNA(Asn)/glutamyl-tRNA(Gln) amidotransferase subunit A
VNLNDVKVAYIKETLDIEGLQKEIHNSVVSLLNKLQGRGLSVKEKNFKYVDSLAPVYYIITAAEAAANFARLDGIRYGYRTREKVDNLEEFVKRNRGEGFGLEVKKRLLFGNYVLTSEGVLEQAQKVRRIILNEIDNIFGDCDFIILPTTPTTAFDLNRQYVSPQESYLTDLFTYLASVCGLPAISIPYGKDDNGLPIGVQIIGHKFEEQKLLSFSKKILAEVNF